MKVRNKITGEINILKVNEDYFNIYQEDGDFVCPVTLKELNDGWEDYYEEPKEYWYIDYDGGILCGEPDNSSAEKMMISMGNHFESLEEAELAVRKLKAWQRLKDKGFKFKNWYWNNNGINGFINFSIKSANIDVEDIELLFGGEDE